MSSALKDISPHKIDQHPGCIKGIKTWAYHHPYIIKILKVAGLILGIGLLASLATPILVIGMGAILAIGGGCLLLASLHSLVASHPPPSTPSFPPPSLKIPSVEHHDASSFKDIDSSVLEHFPWEKQILIREDFFDFEKEFPPPLIGKSDFVSDVMVAHLMRNKKNRAISVKYVKGDRITHMEGALHTFVTPLSNILMIGDYTWAGYLQGKPFGNHQGRRVILSSAIHPDFEHDTVIMPLVKIQDHAVVGQSLEIEEIPSATLKEDEATRTLYEETLFKHMIYHLLPDHRLPSLKEISPIHVMNEHETQVYLEDLIQHPEKDQSVQKFMKITKSTISLELLYQIYIQQLRNEFKILNAHTPQGYVYTINPPSIFSRTVGGAAILNRLQALAFRALAQANLFSHLKILAFSDYADKTMISLLQQVLPKHVQVLSQTDLYKNGMYQGPQGLALVLHNNSDAFGQNIETEGASSLDGVIGSYSNAASVLKRTRPDLLKFIY